MSFYESISTYYEYIFPLNQNQVDFVFGRIKNNATVLEVGSAKGTLTNALSKKYKMFGLDYEQKFIDYSKTNYPQIDFKQGSMLEIDDLYNYHSFDAIICFGNTLVHLKDNQEVDAFILKASKILKHGGKLLIQVINYDRIISQNITKLPVIDNEKIKFERFYRRLDRLIEFNTKLHIKEFNLELENSIALLPIKKHALLKMLKKNHFNDIKLYGSFKGTSLTKDSQPLIIECKKNGRV